MDTWIHAEKGGVDLLEKNLEKKFNSVVKSLGGEACKWTSPGRSGVMDRLVFLPYEVFYLVELKKPGEDLRPLQVYQKEKFEKLGFTVLKIDSVEKLAKFKAEATQKIEKAMNAKFWGFK